MDVRAMQKPRKLSRARRTFIAFEVVLALAISIWSAALAGADSAGAIPGPGTCDYPATGDWGMVGEGLAAQYWWYCDEPNEPANRSHRHCEYYGAATEFQGSFSLFMFSVQAGTHLGAVHGSCQYRCPNQALAKERIPNPPGLWLLGEAADMSKPCASVGDPLPPKPEIVGAPPPDAPPADPAAAPSNEDHQKGFVPPAAGPTNGGTGSSVVH